MKSIIDVRTPAEFALGHISGSINVPLQELTDRIEEIKAMQQPIVLCCASGVRSVKATGLLREFGISCENGGGWRDLMQSVHFQKENS